MIDGQNERLQRSITVQDETMSLDEFVFRYGIKLVLGIIAGGVGDGFMDLAGADPYYTGMTAAGLFMLFFVGTEVGYGD